jgi:hypothetical protein
MGMPCSKCYPSEPGRRNAPAMRKNSPGARKNLPEPPVALNCQRNSTQSRSVVDANWMKARNLLTGVSLQAASSGMLPPLRL